MKIHFLGHAGFCVETENALILMDPWLSEEGASDGAWFQFPSNHHLADAWVEKITASRKAKYLYLSHEHPDHTDLPYLARLPVTEMHLVYPAFSRKRMPASLAPYHFMKKTVFKDREKIAFEDGEMELYLEDTGLDCDSAIYVRAEGASFLNSNDCKLFDRIPELRREKGPVDVFAAQYAGATWHPVCYEMPREKYEKISKEKLRAKLESIAVAIEVLEPKLYLPSAGPPCFLDPALFHLNLEPVSVFARSDRAVAFLDERLPGSACAWPEIVPGDVVDAATGTFDTKLPVPYTEETLEAYLRDYAARCAPHVEKYTKLAETTDARIVLNRLEGDLGDKLAALELRDRVEGPLFFGVDELPGEWVRVDFKDNRVSRVVGLVHPKDTEKEYYLIRTPAWQVDRAIRGVISWEYWSSTFRMRLDRQPDRYQTVLNAFVFLQTEDVPPFSAKLKSIESGRERIEVEAGGCVYEIDRLCPHQGGDMKAGWIKNDRFVVCPKHQWMFDLTKGGKALGNATTVRAVKKEKDPT